MQETPIGANCTIQKDAGGKIHEQQSREKIAINVITRIWIVHVRTASRRVVEGMKSSAESLGSLCRDYSFENQGGYLGITVMLRGTTRTATR